jgi:hypothetical protein
MVCNWLLVERKTLRVLKPIVQVYFFPSLLRMAKLADVRESITRDLVNGAWLGTIDQFKFSGV